LGFGAAVAGFYAARSRAASNGGLDFTETAAGRWQANAESHGSRFGGGLAAFVRRLSGVALDTDRYVVDGVIGTGAGLIRAGLRVFAHVKGERE
ncbi:MAG TPA: hypothetical protein VF407_12980, partial [Polyangiaceae bacterium]